MGTPNPYFAMQQRITDLLTAAPYFAGLQPSQVLTEKIGDLEFAIYNGLLPLGFGVVVTTAEGKSRESEYGALTSDEDFNVSIIHNPKTDLAHDALDAQWAAIEALQGKSVYALGGNLGATTERDFFRVTGHQRRLDGPKDCNVREVHVQAGMRLL